MAKKVFNMQGGRHSAAALSAFINAMYGSSVANGLNVLVTGSTGLSVNVQAGNGNIDTGQGFGRLIQIDAVQNVSLTAASPSNPRNDIIVAYIDNGVTPTTSVIDNTNDVLKFAAIAGTPASTPSDPSNSTIQSAIGAGNPFMILARVRVNAVATSLTQGNITDLRVLVSPPLSTSMIGDLQVTAPKIANGAITAGKIDFATLAFGNYSTSEVDTGFKWIDGKTIYKKTINFGALPNNTSKSVAHGITGITYIIGAKGFADNGNMGGHVFIPQVSPANLAWNISIEVTATNIIILTGDNYSNRTRSYVTIEYVK